MKHDFFFALSLASFKKKVRSLGLGDYLATIDDMERLLLDTQNLFTCQWVEDIWVLYRDSLHLTKLYVDYVEDSPAYLCLKAGNLVHRVKINL